MEVVISMLNEIIDRRSIRKYLDKKVEDEKLLVLLKVQGLPHLAPILNLGILL